jgi:hypothetical protein
MNHVTYRLESELDFQRVTSILNKSKIHYSAKKYTDSNFPSLDLQQGFGDITVSVDNEMELRSMIDELTGTKPQRVNHFVSQNSSKGVSVRKIILISYAFIVSLLCLRYWYLNYRTSEDKNNTFEWNFDAQVLITKRKDSGIISARSIDANYDQNFELIMSYSRQGALLLEWNDLNEDGYYEEVSYYNLKGERTGVQYDRDNDGITEEVIIVLNNGDTLKLYDSNKDGTLEMKVGPMVRIFN